MFRDFDILSFDYGFVFCVILIELEHLAFRIRDRRKERKAHIPHRCEQCAWCLNDHRPQRRGWELTCPHRYGCCQNCPACNPITAPEGNRLQ